MIYDLAQVVKAQLRARKFPHPVTYGPERAQRDGFTIGVVFERDREEGDPIVAPTAGGARSPESPYNRQVSGRVTVYASSTKPGTRAHDHEDECDRVCDGVINAIYRACKEARLPVQITGSRLLTAADFNDCETWPGTAARITFRVTSLVRDVDYTGAGPLTGEVFDVAAPLVTSPDLPDFDPKELVP